MWISYVSRLPECNMNVPKTSLFNKFFNDWIHGFQGIDSIMYKNGRRYHPLSQRRKRRFRPQILQQRRWRPEAAWRWKRSRSATSKHIAQLLNSKIWLLFATSGYLDPPLPQNRNLHLTEVCHEKPSNSYTNSTLTTLSFMFCRCAITAYWVECSLNECTFHFPRCPWPFGSRWSFLPSCIFFGLDYFWPARGSNTDVVNAIVIHSSANHSQKIEFNAT